MEEMVEEEVMLLLLQINLYGHYTILSIRGILNQIMEVMEVKVEVQVQMVKTFILEFH